MGNIRIRILYKDYLLQTKSARGVKVKMTDVLPVFSQLSQRILARSMRSTPQQTAMMAPRSTCQEGGSLGSAVAVVTCPRRRCRFSRAGCTSTASTPTLQSRRNKVCRAKPASRCCRYGAGFHLLIYSFHSREKLASETRHYVC